MLKFLGFFPFILINILLLSACQGSSNSSANSSQTAESLVPINEDELIMALSLLMSADTSRRGRDNNELLNYAIDQLYDVALTSSGLLYQIIKEGAGEPIAWGDFLSVHYKGAFIDGTVFANSHKSKKPLEFYVGNMIDAWNEGLPLIKVGGHIRLLVPSHLGYGEEGLVGSNDKILVPEHQLLVFEVEVLEKKEM